MKAKFLLFFLVVFVFSCEEKVSIMFSESSFEFDKNAVVEINIPKAEGESSISNVINTAIENHIANMLNFSEEESDTILLENAIVKFDTEYGAFKSDFEESALIWEAMFDGEVTYQSSMVITIAINSYLNTGGAHGNMNITLFNFDPATGTVLDNKTLISDEAAFTDLAKVHFKKATQTTGEDGFGEYFFGDDFHLPANIGFNDEGVLLFYNVYEIASYAVGVTEFTIPFYEVESFLNIF